MHHVLENFHMSTEALTPWYKRFLISTLVPLALELAYEIALTEWIKVPNSRYHCSQDSKAFSALA